MPRKISFQKWCDSNRIKTACGLVISTGALVAGVMAYFSSQAEKLLTTKYDGQIAGLQDQVIELQDHLASINRGLAGGTYLNVSKLLVDSSDRSRITKDSHFFADDLFYSISIPGWTHEKLSDDEVFNRIYGASGTKQDNDITKLAPVHLWQRGSMVSIQGHDIIHNICPLIYLQRYSTKKLASELNLRTEDWQSNPLGGVLPSETDKNRSLDVPGLFQGDVVGALLAASLAQTFDTLRSNSDTEVQLVTIEKVANVLYSQVLLTLHNVTVNGQLYTRYYINMETIVISTRDDVYAIVDFIPSDDPTPRGSVAAELTMWFDGFAIPKAVAGGE